jgi:hypothetical protein
LGYAEDHALLTPRSKDKAARSGGCKKPLTLSNTKTPMPRCRLTIIVAAPYQKGHGIGLRVGVGIVLLQPRRACQAVQGFLCPLLESEGTGIIS